MQSLSRLGNMELQKMKCFNTWDAKFWYICIYIYIKNCGGCQGSKTNPIVFMSWKTKSWVMKDIFSKRLVLKLFTPKSFKTWKAKSWILQSWSRLGTWSCKNRNISKLGMPSLDNHVHFCCSCLWRPSHEMFYSWQASSVEIIYPKKNQDLENQVLNCVMIVKTWGHVVANMPKKTNPIVFVSWKTKSWVMKEILSKRLVLKLFTPKSFKTWKAKSWILQSWSRLGNMELQK